MKAAVLVVTDAIEALVRQRLAVRRPTQTDKHVLLRLEVARAQPTPSGEKVAG
jgi:hypothetical protein